MTLAYIALGSNLGDRERNLEEALRLLGAVPGIRVVRASSAHETDPVGGPPGQGKYLNAAAEIETSLTPEALLFALHQVEEQLGRVRTIRNAPRTIDLDLLLYGDLVRHSPTLMVPHPSMHVRSFVLAPLLEVAPFAVHPILKRTIANIAGFMLTASPAVALPLHGKRALITGATSGIGLAIAKQFLSAGADVILHGRRPKDSLHEVRDFIGATPSRQHYLRADLTDPDQYATFAVEAWSLWDGLDVLVNNAGADVLTGEGAEWSFYRKFHELLGVDLNATIFLSRMIGGQMKSAGRGAILNMGWDQAETGMEGDSGQLFAAIKGGVMAFTKSLAKTLAPEVRVNCLAPGWIRTAWAESASQAWQDRAVCESLLHRWGTPEDVANTAVWLASDHASFINGQNILINGGHV